jgi:hypothetical protein
MVTSLVADGQQVLVFRTSVAKTQTTAERLKAHLPAPGLPSNTAALLDDLEPSESVDVLRRTLASLVGFHNADLGTGERRAVEQSFRLGEARVLVATTTLAMGVNLPTDVVVIADTQRFAGRVRGQWRTADISVAEYKNCAGRAGRLGQKTGGLAIVLADQDFEQRQLLDLYCRGDVEAVASQLAAERFDDVVFGILCGGLARNRAELVEFITATFAYLTFYEMGGGVRAIKDGVDRAIAACRESGLVRDEDGQLIPTRSALIFAAHSVPLAAAARLSTLAEQLLEGLICKEELVFAVASHDNLFEPRPYSDWDRVRRQPVDPRPGLRIDLTNVTPDAPLRTALTRSHPEEQEIRVVTRTGCLLEWMEGVDERTLARRYKGCPAARVRAMGKNAAWLLDALDRVATLRGAGEDEVAVVHGAALEARYGVPAELAPLARLRAPGVGRAALLRLYEGDEGRQLYEPDVFLDAAVAEFDGLLKPVEVERLRSAIVAERGETLRRRRQGHLDRAERAHLDAKLIEDLYTADGGALEQAVVDALDSAGLSVSRVTRQSHGEEDLQIRHLDGTVVVSVTASQDEAKRVAWSKAREVLGTGAGMNPINYVCVARPGFHSLAERKAEEIAHEQGERRLLLVPIDVLAEAVVRVREELLEAATLGDLLARSRGVLAFNDLPAAEPAGVVVEQT